jgi:Tfp pilus assembly protein PilF
LAASASGTRIALVFGRFSEVHVSPALQLNAEGTGMAFGHCKLRFWLFRILFLGGFLLSPAAGAVRLPKQGTEEPSSGTVSVRELQERVPSKARKAYERALAEYRKGNTGKAIADLEKAIQIDPSFADAHNDLGGCYARLGQADKAVVEFAEASSLDPDSAVMMYNFALTLVGLKRFAEAEDAARAALKLAPSLAQAHFVLGYSLYQQRRFGQEAVDNLVWASRQVPRALLIAAEVLVREGRLSEAARQLKRYLASPETGPDRERVQSWLEKLGQ